MMTRGIHKLLMSGVGVAALVTAGMPATAMARTAYEARLEARIKQLETIVAQMQGQMATTQVQNQQLAEQNRQIGEQAAQASAASAQANEKVATLAAKPAAPAEGFRSGNTTIKLGGYIKAVANISRFANGEVAANSLGRDFYLPQTIPTGNAPGSTVHDFSAKQTRLWMNLNSDIAGHTVKGYVETDFQTTASAAPTVTNGGSQRTTNGYTLALRRAYVQVDRFTFGQDWTTFQNAATLPESTDYVGVTEGTVFVRQPQVRYSAPLGKGTTLHIAAENSETASAVAGATALTENDDDRMPDFAARLSHTGSFGELSLAGLVRELSVANAGVGDRKMGWGASASGKLWLNGKKSADLRFMATYGQGIGRYVGLNFAPDTIVAAGQLHRVDNFAAFGALRLPLASNLRTNLMASYQHAKYPSVITIADFNSSAWSVAGNLFWTPVKNVDVGIEVRHGRRELVSGVSGQLDRMEFAAKYNF